MPKPNSDKWMSTTQVARLLYAHPNTIRKWADTGLIPMYRLGLGYGRRQFKREDVARFIGERVFTTRGTVRRRWTIINPKGKER